MIVLLLVYVCRYTFNFYSFLNAINSHYQKMKNWIFEELTQAEKAGDKVCVYVCVCAVCSSDLNPPPLTGVDPSSHPSWGYDQSS